METYGHTQNCPNCSKPNELNIPKGTIIADYIKTIKCFNCGIILSWAPGLFTPNPGSHTTTAGTPAWLETHGGGI